MSTRAFSMAAIAALFLLPTAGAQAAARHVDGTVISKDASTRTFRMTTEGGSQLRIKVNASTDFERIAGFGGLTKGLAIEVDAVKTSSGWVARQIETQGGGGSGGGGDNGGDDHGGGHDDGPNHT